MHLIAITELGNPFLKKTSNEFSSEISASFEHVRKIMAEPKIDYPSDDDDDDDDDADYENRSAESRKNMDKEFFRKQIESRSATGISNIICNIYI